MRLLLDTHIFLWWIKGNNKLSKTLRSRISNADEVYISSASIWEMTIKIKLKKLDGNLNEIIRSISESGFVALPITARHAATVAELPDFHRDPFDQILIAQAISEPLAFLTLNAQLKSYSDLVHVID